MVTTHTQHTENESFAKLLEESMGTTNIVGKVVKGTIISLDDNFVLVDVGLKSEGRIPLSEFHTIAQQSPVKLGDIVDVYVEKMEDRDGLIVLSREKAKREAAWKELEVAWQKSERVMGVIFGRVKASAKNNTSGCFFFTSAINQPQK